MKGVIGALALCSALLMPIGARAAHATRTYRNPALRYGIEYSMTWLRIAVAGADFAVVAPDRNGFVSVSTTAGKANAIEIQRALAQVFTAFGQPLGGPTYQALMIHGATGTLARDRVTTSVGKTSLVRAFVLSRHGLIYTILGVVRDVDAHAAAQETKTVMATISSTTIF